MWRRVCLAEKRQLGEKAGGNWWQAGNGVQAVSGKVVCRQGGTCQRAPARGELIARSNATSAAWSRGMAEGGRQG